MVNDEGKTHPLTHSNTRAHTQTGNDLIQMYMKTLLHANRCDHKMCLCVFSVCTCMRVLMLCMQAAVTGKCLLCKGFKKAACQQPADWYSNSYSHYCCTLSWRKDTCRAGKVIGWEGEWGCWEQEKRGEIRGIFKPSSKDGTPWVVVPEKQDFLLSEIFVRI